MGDAISKCTECNDVGDMDMEKLKAMPDKAPPARAAGPPPTDINQNDEMLKMVK